MKQVADAFLEALLAVDRWRAREILEREQSRSSIQEAVEEVVVPALDAIGAGWETGAVSLSQVYLAGKICEELVESALDEEIDQTKGSPEVAIGVLDDYHFLGKRIVTSAVRSAGIPVQDYGHVGVEEAVERTLTEGVRILLLSTLMLPSALQIREVTHRIHERDGRVRIVVGGAPFRFDSQLWREVGADAMGASSANAVTIVRRFQKEAS